jgi:hypothetical protein
LDQEVGTILVKLNKKGAADKVVKKFVATRDKFLAHKDPNFLLPSRGPKKVADLSWNDVEHLLSLANRLLTKYSLLFAASAYSTTMHCQDDYKYVLETINKRIESHKADEEADMKKYLGKSK